MRALIKEALLEDAVEHDITSLAIFGKTKIPAVGYLIAKEKCILSGLDIARDVFHAVSAIRRAHGPWGSGAAVPKKIRFITGYANGGLVEKWDRIAKVEGNVSDLLRAERVALNFLQHLSGVATLTHQFVEAIKPYPAQILDTRKTIPGLRFLEKRAVHDGGGFNHRMNLSDQFLIKDNHIATCGGVREAIRRVKEVDGKKIIEVEAKNLKEVKEALEEGADIILLDNMTLAQIRKSVKLVKGKCPLEVSGGVSLKNVRKIAQTGVARISIGKLTHSAPAVDISFELNF